VPDPRLGRRRPAAHPPPSDRCWPLPASSCLTPNAPHLSGLLRVKDKARWAGRARPASFLPGALHGVQRDTRELRMPPPRRALRPAGWIRALLPLGHALVLGLELAVPGDEFLVGVGATLMISGLIPLPRTATPFPAPSAGEGLRRPPAPSSDRGWHPTEMITGFGTGPPGQTPAGPLEELLGAGRPEDQAW